MEPRLRPGAKPKLPTETRNQWLDLAPLALALFIFALGLSLVTLEWRKAHTRSPVHRHAPAITSRGQP